MSDRTVSLWFLFLVFVKIWCIAFGNFYTTLMIIVGAGLAGLILYPGQKPDTVIVH